MAAGKQIRLPSGVRINSGAYQVSYIGPDGKRHSKSFSHLEDAKYWQAFERRMIDQGEWSSPAVREHKKNAATLTVSEWTEQRMRAWATRTVADRRQHRRELQASLQASDRGRPGRHPRGAPDPCEGPRLARKPARYADDQREVLRPAQAPDERRHQRRVDRDQPLRDRRSRKTPGQGRRRDLP